jgi:hypothetical protein
MLRGAHDDHDGPEHGRDGHQDELSVRRHMPFIPASRSRQMRKRVSAHRWATAVPYKWIMRCTGRSHRRPCRRVRAASRRSRPRRLQTSSSGAASTLTQRSFSCSWRGIASQTVQTYRAPGVGPSRSKTSGPAAPSPMSACSRSEGSRRSEKSSTSSSARRLAAERLAPERATRGSSLIPPARATQRRSQASVARVERGSTPQDCATTRTTMATTSNARLR